LGDSGDSTLNVKNCSVRNSSGTNDWIRGWLAFNGNVRRTDPSCSFRYRRANSISTPRRNSTATVDRPA